VQTCGGHVFKSRPAHHSFLLDIYNQVCTGLEDARLLLVERCGETSLQVTPQFMDELRYYLGSSPRETILGDVGSGDAVYYIRS
ncbi:MAG: hypothetical protein ACFFAZ_13095, partial [Promethearchaeota archaeon]